MTRRSLTVRCPEDLLACVPLLLGFLPTSSAVVVALPPGSGPHARADVDASTDLAVLADSLVSPALRHGVERVAVVVYDDLAVAAGVADHLAEAFTDAGIEPVAVLAADGSSWVSVRPSTTTPREYDALAHPFVTEAVVGGQVVLGSRAAVRDQLALDAQLAAAVVAAGEEGALPFPVPPAWVQQCLAQHVRKGSLPDADEVARLLEGISRPDGRDAAWAWVAAPDARTHVEIWLRVVRGCPPPRRAAAAAVLAFHAWLAGDGALAWCAVDASYEAQEPCSLTVLVEDLLVRAAPPALWSPLLEAPGAVEEGWAEPTSAP